MSKKPFTATSRIKRNGKLYEPGDTMKLTEDEAERLHVVSAEESSQTSEISVSTDAKANEAIAMIESTPYERLEGFVPGDEDRVTVLDAWKEKQKEAVTEGESEAE